MERAAIPDPPGFDQLSKAEQIRYLQSLWDRISKNPADIPVLESHVTVAEERFAEYQRSPENVHTAYEILDTMYRQSRDRLHAPVPVLRQMVSAGLLGRKSGRGFYEYS